MNAATQKNQHPALTRILAGVLLVAFVLQAAARASQGCVARAFGGSCCCVEAATENEPMRSCCAHADEGALDGNGPVVDAARACHCEAVALPGAPAAPKSADGTGERAHERSAKALAVSHGTVLTTVAERVLDLRPQARPPDRARLPPRPFAVDRGNSGRMSRLRVCLR